jgi:hypothetical protein
VNVIGSVIFIVAVTGMVANVLWQIRRQKSAAA